MTRDNNPDRLDDGARAEAEMNAREGYCTDCESFVTIHNGRCGCGSGRVITALPAPQGDDGQVGEIQRRLDAFHSPSFDREIVEKLLAGYRAQAAEIERWAKNALDNDDSRIAAEAEIAKLKAERDTAKEATAFYVEKYNSALSEARIGTEAAEAKLTSAMEALTEAEETLRLSEHPSIVDPVYGVEVAALGMRIGFGALMSSASASWCSYLAARGMPTGSEFVAGPCYGSVIKALTKVRTTLSSIKGASDAAS